MCGFMVYTANDIKVEDFEEGFIRISYRGPDFCIIESRERGLWGFHRLSVMGVGESGNQPFELHNNLVVCNGEIYGFKKIKEQLNPRYVFNSDSDCEVILPLYETYGLDFFKQLDDTSMSTSAFRILSLSGIPRPNQRSQEATAFSSWRYSAAMLYAMLPMISVSCFIPRSDQPSRPPVFTSR